MNFAGNFETNPFLCKLSKLGIAEAVIVVLLIILLFLSAFILQVLIHEAGHLVFGLLSKHDFLYFRFFYWIVVKENKRLVIKRCKTAGIIGQCIMVPSSNKSYSMCTIGGIIFNYISSVIAIFAALISNNPLGVFFFFCIAVLGSIMALINARPSKATFNDGYVYKTTKRNIHSKNSQYYQLLVMEALMYGITYKGMPEEWFVTNDNELSETMVAYQKLLQYYRHLDEGDAQEADICLSMLETHKKDLHKEIRQEIAIERLFLSLLDMHKDPSVDKRIMVETRYVKVKNLLKEPYMSINAARVSFAYRFIKGNIKENEVMPELDKVIDLSILLGEKEFNKKILTNIMNKAI